MTTAICRPGARASSAAAQRLRSGSLAGPAGRLEALLNEGAQDAPFAALVCHPHPLGGGTMHNKVVYHAAKVLNAPEWGLGWPVLRFNFRGTGLSEGMHDGSAETGDVLAALDWLEHEFGRPIIAAGFSFGAAMTLAACCGPQATGATKAVKALVALGLPTHSDRGDYDYPFLADCAIPKLFISGDHDQFASPAELKRLAADAAEPKHLALVPGADHFFTGQLEKMQTSLCECLKELVQ